MIMHFIYLIVRKVYMGSLIIYGYLKKADPYPFEKNSENTLGGITYRFFLRRSR